MPPSEVLDWRIASGNCGNSHWQGAGRGAARDSGKAARLAEAAAENALIEKIGKFHWDPPGYVAFAFPLGQPGTALADDSGPEPWQRDILEKLGQGRMSAVCFSAA
jgi:hypothetical protein